MTLQNDIAKLLAKDNPDNPVASLGTALSKVSEFISESFDHADTIEKNIIVTINAYTKIRDDLIAYENQQKQSQANIDSKEERKIRRLKSRLNIAS